jgi:hypothetical protein
MRSLCDYSENLTFRNACCLIPPSVHSHGYAMGTLRGNPVKIRSCPAAVIGNEQRISTHWFLL